MSIFTNFFIYTRKLSKILVPPILIFILVERKSVVSSTPSHQGRFGCACVLFPLPLLLATEQQQTWLPPVTLSVLLRGRRRWRRRKLSSHLPNQMSWVMATSIIPTRRLPADSPLWMCPYQRWGPEAARPLPPTTAAASLAEAASLCVAVCHGLHPKPTLSSPFGVTNDSPRLACSSWKWQGRYFPARRPDRPCTSGFPEPCQSSGMIGLRLSAGRGWR